MKPLSFILCTVLMLPLYVCAQDSDPTFWEDPYNGIPEDTVGEPIFWDDPYVGIPEDTVGDPGTWDDPYYTDPVLTELTITDNGLPPEAEECMQKGTVLTITLQRNLVGGMYNTLCLPFDVPDVANSPLAGCKVVGFQEAYIEDNALIINFDYVTSINAGDPYLIAPSTAITAPMIFPNTTITAVTGNRLDGGAMDFVGILAPYQIPYDHATLFLGTNNTLHYANNDGSSLKGLRAYFAPHDSQKLPAKLLIGPRQNATELTSIQDCQSQVKKVVLDGKMYIVTNGQVRDMLGLIIK